MSDDNKGATDLPPGGAPDEDYDEDLAVLESKGDHYAARAEVTDQYGDAHANAVAAGEVRGEAVSQPILTPNTENPTIVPESSYSNDHPGLDYPEGVTPTIVQEQSLAVAPNGDASTGVEPAHTEKPEHTDPIVSGH